MILRSKTALALPLALITLVLFGLALYLATVPSSVDANTPPTNGEIRGEWKPDDFVLHLPFRKAGDVWATYTYGTQFEGRNTTSTHNGRDYFAIDFGLSGPDSRAGRAGDDVFPVAEGTVTFADWTQGDFSDLGQVVFIDHGNGYQSFYAHLSKISVKSGRVTPTTKIGEVGCSGMEDQGCPNHLHFSLRKGAQTTPYTTNGKLSVGPWGGTAVVPEPLVGEQVYEGFRLTWPGKPNTWPNGPGWYGPLRSEEPNLVDSVLGRPSAVWSSSATGSGSSIGGSDRVHLAIDQLPADTKEIRFTAYYDDWSKMPDETNRLDWRILARCWPGKPQSEQPGCVWSNGNTSVAFDWDPHQDSLRSNAPWDPQGPGLVNPAYKPNGTVQVCVSFDLFDQSGNVSYAADGARCGLGSSRQSAAETEVTAASGDSAARALSVLPPSPHSVDSAQFISDVTLPDRSPVSPGQAMRKVWHVKNTGTTTWSGYRLAFVQGDKMSGRDPTPVPAVAPGQEADIALDLTAPTTSNQYTGYWQIRNAAGADVSGGKLWVTVKVQSESSAPSGTSHIVKLTADPASPSSASVVKIRPQVTPWPQFRSVRVWVDNQIIDELGATEPVFDWNAATAARGDHTIVLEVADQSDRDWSHPERTTIHYTLTGTAAPANHSPNRPIINEPGVWAATFASQMRMCAQAQGDPDGDTVNEYYFEFASGSTQGWNSGWTSSNCVTATGLNPGTYYMHAKVRDSKGGESDWSDSRPFSLQNPTLSVTRFDLVALDSQSNEVKVIACGGGPAGTIRFSVNTANDGSESGEWRYFYELGVPCFSDNNAPTWPTAEWGDGTHVVRVEVRGSGPSWNDAAMAKKSYYLPHRKPAGPGLVAPLSATGSTADPVYLPSQTVTFKWTSALRANSYTLFVGTSPSPETDPNVLRQDLPAGTTEFTPPAFASDYPALYWRVAANNDAGSSYSGVQLFGIDRQAPTCAVQALPTAVYENAFQVKWGGNDSPSGIRTFDVQVTEPGRDAWRDWQVGVAAAKPYDIFVGQPGHIYSFRCRATDNAGNQGAYPVGADASTRVDPASRPPTTWWQAGYANKRNLTIVNSMPATTLPTHYPIKLHFDSSTSPTAQEIYNGSLASVKGNDVRIVYGDAAELDRQVQLFTSTQIDIWFALQADIGGGGTGSADYQIYYGNASAGAPPMNSNNIYAPAADANTVGLWHFAEGGGSTVTDTSGRGHNGTFYGANWVDGLFGWAGAIANSGSVVEVGSQSDYNNTLPLTLEAWIYLTQNPNNPSNIITKGVNGSGQYRLWVNGGSVQFAIDGAPQSVVSRPLALNTWYHVAGVHDGANRCWVFVNGEGQGYTENCGAARWTSDPVHIGNTTYWSNSWFPGYIQHVRISNVARTDFPYAKITQQPSVALGDLVPKPGSGAPDLVLQSLKTYPVDGQTFRSGVIVEAVVKNQGTASTTNGFYTDFYANHLPTGTGDYTGSVRFFVNEPIAAGATTTLTTVLDTTAPSSSASAESVDGDGRVGALSLLSDLATAGPGGEASATLYAQTDSAGVVKDSNRTNNVSSGTQICVANADAYESDNSADGATGIGVGSTQHHNFHSPGDADWFKFSAQEGVSYTLSTSNLGSSADTYLYLYGPDGTTLLASNDDYGNSLGSQIVWKVPANGTYYLLSRQWNPNLGGCATGYDLSVGVTSYHVYVPMVQH